MENSQETTPEAPTPTPEGANPEAPAAAEDGAPFPVFSVTVHLLSDASVSISGPSNAAVSKAVLYAGMEFIDTVMANQRLERANANAPRIAVPKAFVPPGMRGVIR